MGKRSHFADLLDYHINSRNAIDGTTEADIGRIIGKGQTAISDYRTGAVRPPLALVSELANALDIHGKERERFVEEAYLAHAPDRIRSLVDDLRRQIRNLEAVCRKHGLDPAGA